MKKVLLFVGAMMLTATSMAQYCQPTYNNACTSGDMIDGFELNTINNTGTGCANPGANNYTDYTATDSTDLVQGQTYSVTCTPGASWGQSFGVWIDFDQDMTFDQANEFFDIGYAAAGASVTTDITIPNGVMGGPTTLRVLCHFGTTPVGQGDACSAQTWGETEDYRVIISTPPPYEAGAISVDAPSTGCGMGLDTIQATFQNNGTMTVDTLVLCYSVNNGAWVCDTATGLALASNTTYQHDFTQLFDFSTAGDYTIDVAVSLAGDTISVNDTLTGYFLQSVPTISSLPYSENFESGTGGWTASGAASNWEHGVATEANVFGNGGCASGDSMVWATGLSAPYNSNTLSYLESPCIDFSSLTADPMMSFDHLFNTEPGFDPHSLEISLDGGTTWNVLGGQGTGLNWYNNTDSWDGLSYTNPGEWRKAAHVLTGAAGNATVRVRFVMQSDGSVQREGVAIDNINIDVVSPLYDASVVSLDAPVSGCGLTNAETIMATYTNTGVDTLFTFDVCYTVNGGTQVCETVNDTLAPGGTYMHTFGTTADFSVVGVANVDLSVSVAELDTCNNAWSGTVQNKPVINTFPYIERFENGPGGWDANNANNGTWELTTPNAAVINSAASGVNAWVTNATGNYNVNDNSYVEGPCFDFTNLDTNSWVAMKVWWESENSWDGANLQISIDTGATWTNIGANGDPHNWYNDNSISGAPGGSQEGWTGDVNNNGSGEWVIAKHPLDTALIGQPHVLFRVNFGSDGSVTREGFAFDDFAIGVPPTVNIGADYTGCGNYEIDPGLTTGTFEWFAQDTSTMVSTLLSTDPVGVFPNPSANDTTYNAIFVYTDTLGLCGMDTAQVTLHPAPWNVLNDTTICYNDSVWYSVEARPQYTYSWNNGATADSSLYIYTTGGLVEVTVTDTVSGCPGTFTANIIQTPAVSLDDVTACMGDTVILDATDVYSTYLWSNLDTTSMIQVTADGSFTVIATDAIGCQSDATANVTFNALPTVSITGGQDTICVYNDVTLDAGSGFSAYAWSTNGTNQTETVDGSTLGTGSHDITVTVTDANNCMNSATTTIVVDECAGIDELTLSFDIYPNPSEDVFNYVIDGSVENTAMTVTDVLGKVVWTAELTEAAGTIDLGSYAPGTYYLNIAQNNASKTIILVKR